MKHPPELVGGERVVRWSHVDGRHRPTGACKQIVAGQSQGPVACLAICECKDGCYYLFGCDSDWNVITDTWHETVEDALDQAEFEYEGISKTWNVA
jgi:hypothetical protein